MKPGDMVAPNETPRVPSPGNPDGTGIPAFDNTFKRLGYIMPGYPLLVLVIPGTLYVKVLGPVGPVWVAARHLKQL